MRLSGASNTTYTMITSLASMISVVPTVSKNQNLYLLYTLNYFDVICSFFNLTDLGSLADLGGRTELQCMISSKISEI